jgi:beta-hydroxylase
MRSKDWIKVIILLGIGYFIPRLSLFYLICGILDFKRSKSFESESWQRYFLGNGILTWILSPFNLLMDLLCYKNKGIYQLQELPLDCQEEIKQLVEIAKNKPEIIAELSNRMAQKKRGMIFFKWYGKNVNTSLDIPEFHQKFKYITTIGVSIFNKNQSTSIHYGPLRVTLRVLYNLTPVQNDNIYIKVADYKHLWHDNPLFIFDDTLVHQSINASDLLRYCMFVDILRPSKYLIVVERILKLVRVLIMSFNRVFYKNWDIIK